MSNVLRTMHTRTLEVSNIRWTETLASLGAKGEGLLFFASHGYNKVQLRTLWHPKEKLWLNLQRTVDKWGRTGKNGAGWHPPGGGDTRVKSIKVTTVMSKKGRQFLREK